MNLRDNPFNKKNLGKILAFGLSTALMSPMVSFATDKKSKSSHGIANTVLRALDISPEERGIQGNIGQIGTGFTAAIAGLAIERINKNVHYISIMWSPGSDPADEEIANFKKQLQSMKDRYPDAVFRHGYPPVNYLTARGWKTGVVDAINSVYDLEDQDMAWKKVPGAMNYTADDWKKVITDGDKHKRLMTEMRTGYMSSISDSAAKSTVFVLGNNIPMDPAVREEAVKRKKLSAGIAEEVDMLQRYNIPYTQVPHLDMPLVISEAELKQRSETNKKGLKLKAIKLTGGVVGIYAVIQGGIKLYIGTLNSLEDYSKISISE